MAHESRLRLTPRTMSAVWTAITTLWLSVSLAVGLTGCAPAPSLRQELPAVASPARPDRVASVNGESVDREEWRRAYALDAAMSILAGQPPPAVESALQRLVNERLVLRAAREAGIFATPAQAQARLTALLARWGVGDTQLEQALSRSGLSRAQAVEAIRRLLIVETYLKGFASAEAASTWLAQQRQQARVSVYIDLAADTRLIPGEQADIARVASISPAAPYALTPLVLAPATPDASETPAAMAEIVTPGPADALPIDPQFDLSLPDLAGQIVSLSQLRGQVVVVNVWASWCPACRSETPDFAEFARAYRERGVTVLGVNLREDAATVRAFAESNGVDYPLLLDSQGEVAARYQVVGIPTTVIFDAAGNMQRRHVGVLTRAQLADYVEPLLAPRRPAPAFALPDNSGRVVSLAEHRGQPVVLLFYRSAGCASCQQHLAAVQAAYDRFRSRNAIVLAVAAQSVSQAKATRELGRLAFPVLADDDHAASEAFGVFNLFGDGLAAPAVFVIDAEGGIVWSHIGQSPTDYPLPDMILQRIP